MSLRARLAAAFFALILGPVLLAAAMLLAVLSKPEGDARLDQAARGVRAAVAARCHALEASARALAIVAAVRDESYAVTPEGERGPWALCGVDPSRGIALSPNTRYRGLAARAEVRGPDGTLRGYAFAVQPLDERFLAQLSAAAGVRVMLRASGDPGGTTALGPDAGQPLPLVLSPEGGSGPPLVLNFVVMLAAGAAAAVLGWWLSGVATRPLADLLAVAQRVSSGDLSARVEVSGRDETGQLGRALDQLVTVLRETQRLSVTDALTGLGNLRHLNDSLRLEIERANRFGHPLGVLVIDLDHFKLVNDKLGHRAGDAVLVEFARRIRGSVREVDLCFRQGGEEFVILLPETDVAGSLTAARRVGDAVRSQPFTVPGQGGDIVSMSITASIGVAVFPRHGCTSAQVLEAADEALYAAKHAGRDTYVLASTKTPPILPASGASGGTVPHEAGAADTLGACRRT